MKKPTVQFSSNTADGNIYNILGKVRCEMRKHSLIDKYNNLRDDVMVCDSYAAAITRIRQDVDLIDIDGEV